MNRSSRLLIVLAASLLLGSCEDSTNTVYVPHEFADAVRYYRNVPWNLSRAITSDTVVDLSRHRPFLMLLSDTSIFGYDGCNWYNANYELHGDTVSINFVGRTERACFHPRQFQCEVFEDQWTVALSGNTLSFTGLKSYLQFQSDVTEPVVRYFFVGKRLTLSASNDSLFGLLDSLELLPNLELSINREYHLRWDVGCSLSVGFFGIGPGSTIRFAEYWPGWCNKVEYPIMISGLKFATSFHRSNRFSVTDSTTTFLNTETGIYYRFLQERSPDRGDD